MDKLKQKLFDQTKQLDLLRYYSGEKEQRLKNKKLQCSELAKTVRRIKKKRSANIWNNKKIVKLENKWLTKKMRLEEAQFINQKYKEIKDILLQEQKHFEKQLDTLIEELKDSKSKKESIELLKEKAKLARDLQSNKFDKSKNRLEKTKQKQKTRIVKYQNQLSKLKTKQDKQTVKKSTIKKEDSIYKNDKAEENFYEETLQTIKDITGVSSIEEFEEKYFQQQTTRKELGTLRDELQQRLKELKNEETELEITLEKLRDTNNYNKMDIAKDLNQKELALLAKQQQNENEMKQINKLLGTIKLSLQHIFISLQNILIQENYEIPTKNLSTEELLELCNDAVKILLKNIKDHNLQELKKKIELEGFQEQLKPVIVSDIKLRKELSVKNPSLSDNDENLEECRASMKEAAKKFVETNTKNKSEQIQIIQL
ncbi:outer dynein arm-docking complex subunit 3-like [Centruroides vittatus]|uniref:outer dynein arm-docking complex subunit 3-like n=1 Tax=Centruroides vittatus TaxID=120091 RepID=UPI0035104C10